MGHPMLDDSGLKIKKKKKKKGAEMDHLMMGVAGFKSGENLNLISCSTGHNSLVNTPHNVPSIFLSIKYTPQCIQYISQY